MAQQRNEAMQEGQNRLMGILQGLVGKIPAHHNMPQNVQAPVNPFPVDPNMMTNMFAKFFQTNNANNTPDTNTPNNNNNNTTKPHDINSNDHVD